VASSIDPDEARRQAATILAERRFQPDRSPRPFASILDWFGARLRALGRPFGWLARQLNKVLPGGGSVVWIVLTLAAIVVVALAARRIGLLRRRRSAASASVSVDRLSADDLERLATDAEQNGDLNLSVRLRFRAGLRRLADGRAIHAPEQRANGEIGRQLNLAGYTSLAQRFDAIAYADAAATTDDVNRSRVEWPTIVRDGIDRREALRTSPSARPTGRGLRARWRRRRFDRRTRNER
jgi:hypothetical protein